MVKNTQTQAVNTYGADMLSPSICAGILRRAEIRGKAIPPQLRTALQRRAKGEYTQ